MLQNRSFASPLSAADNLVAVAVNVVPIASYETEEWFISLRVVFASHRTVDAVFPQHIDDRRVNATVEFRRLLGKRIVDR